ncbi:MAG TPA: DoxX-like family protein [Aquabacterium sp.]|uniref:DoxX-like family protein n=1 Tax=Aquabacterium sp. TaxID=1872578 RepID=UPI002E301A35|nr:DoxX-like family protein [Aquabacterium sp.]HEX5356901.1 DoxX-like family protein [Aquabacterium sp.]
MALKPVDRQLARFGLIAVWIWTALVSVQQAHGLSAQLLQASAIPAPLYPWIIWGGAGVDLLLGLLMWLRPASWVYLTAMGMTLTMTLIGTWVDPALWLHPLGPLSKNLPILALLWIVARDEP